jgi:hypothetical protein
MSSTGYTTLTKDLFTSEFKQKLNGYLKNRGGALSKNDYINNHSGIFYVDLNKKNPLFNDNIEYTFFLHVSSNDDINIRIFNHSENTRDKYYFTSTLGYFLNNEGSISIENSIYNVINNYIPSPDPIIESTTVQSNKPIKPKSSQNTDSYQILSAETYDFYRDRIKNYLNSKGIHGKLGSKVTESYYDFTRGADTTTGVSYLSGIKSRNNEYNGWISLKGDTPFIRWNGNSEDLGTVLQKENITVYVFENDFNIFRTMKGGRTVRRRFRRRKASYHKRKRQSTRRRK